jgi:hypothetical protein
MNPRTRAVLSALGVPVWTARQRAVRQITPAPLWRDVVEQDNQPIQPVSRFETREQVVQTQLGNVRIHHGSPPNIVIHLPQSTPISSQPPTPTEATVSVVKPVIAEAMAIRFAVEVLVLPSWLLVVSSQQLEDIACRQLWEQLQTVFAKQPVEWFWPLAEGVRWQTAPYAAVALQGLLARLHPQARVGLMGELPDQVLPDRVERLPSLSRLIEQPLHKRMLWQLLHTEVTASLR